MYDPQKERNKQRDAYIMLIMAAVGLIYILWAVSWLFAPDRSGEPAPPRPRDAVSRLEAELDISARLIASGRDSEALRHLNNVRNAIKTFPEEGVRPALALRLSRVKKRLSELQARLRTSRKGNGLASPSGDK